MKLIADLCNLTGDVTGCHADGPNPTCSTVEQGIFTGVTLGNKIGPSSSTAATAGEARRWATVLSLLFAAPLALVLPGYGIAAVIFARGRSGRAISPSSARPQPRGAGPGGAALNYGPGGVRAGSWTLLLFLVVLGCCRARRCGGRAAAGPRSGAAPLRQRRPDGAGRARRVAIVAAVGPRLHPARGHQRGRLHRDLDPALARAAPASASGSAAASARLLLPARGRFADSPSRRRRSISTRPAGGAGARAKGPAAPPAQPVAVTATLFKEDSPDPERPFRQVSAWIRAGGSPDEPGADLAVDIVSTTTTTAATWRRDRERLRPDPGRVTVTVVDDGSSDDSRRCWADTSSGWR